VGAYTFTQSMQFIHLRPACVLISEQGGVELIRRKETLEDLINPEIVPERLAISPSQTNTFQPCPELVERGSAVTA